MRASEEGKARADNIDRTIYDVKDKVDAAFVADSSLTSKIINQISVEKKGPE